MSTAAFGLAFAAGALSTLSPCVLPLLPIVVGTAASEHRLAPVALAGGVALALTAIGLFVATLGFSIGLDATLFRMIAAVLLIGIGVVLTAPALQVKIAVAAAPIGNLGRQSVSRFLYLGYPRSVRCRDVARCRVEPLRRPNIGRRFSVGQSGPEPRQRGHDDGVVRQRRGAATSGPRRAVA